MTSEILITKDFHGGLSNNTESDLNSKVGLDKLFNKYKLYH